MGLIILYISLILIFSFYPILKEIRSGKFEIFNFKNAFILYYVIQLCFSGILSLVFSVESETTMDLIGKSRIIYYEKAFLAALLGIFFFNFGYYSINKKIKMPLFLSTKWQKSNVYFVSSLYFIIGFISLFFLIKNGGGFVQFLNDIETFRAGGLLGQGFLLYPATRLLTLAVLIIFIWTFLNVERSKVNKSRFFFLIILSILPATILGFRGLMILPLINFIVAYHFLFKKINSKKLVVFGSFVLVIFVFLGVYRNIPPGIDIDTSQLIEVVKKNPELAYSFVSRSKGTEVVASVIQKLEKTGEYDLGYKAFFESLTILIPRTLWTGKPKPASVRFTTYFFGSNLNITRGIAKDDWGGVSPTIIGEFFWHFGWFGVIVFMFIFGIFSKILYITFLNNLNHPSIVLIYVMAFTPLIMFAEALQGNINGLMMDFLFITITIILLRVKIIYK